MIGVGAAAVASAVIAFNSEWEPANASPLNRSIAWRGIDQFASPPRSVAPKFRWWWPNGQVIPEEIRRDVDAVADAGCGGLEVADVHHSGTVVLDVATHGWGSAPWIAGLDAALSQAAKRGISIDLSAGPSWPSSSSAITPDDVAASQELAHGVLTVVGGATFTGTVPEPTLAAASGVTTKTLFAVQAARTVGAPVKSVQTLDPTSLVDLTATVSGGQLSWTAPAGTDTWVLLAYWTRGSGQQPESGPFTSPTSYVVDHFSLAGTRAIEKLWERDILSDRIRRLLKQAGGAFFEDSLEIETKSTIWTAELPTAFAARTGYDLLPYLPVLVQLSGKYQFAFESHADAHVRDDMNVTLSDLYRDNHLLALRSWTHSLGMVLRVQPYGLSTDSIDFSALVDIPEGESLGFKNLDDYRVMTGGRDLAGHTILSCEAICYANGAYSTTWNKALQTIGSFYAGGVNQTVIHGFAYSTADGATWPGFAAFSPYNVTGIGYSEAWGPRQPTWQHMPDIAGYMARSQYVLQLGVPKYDVLFYRQKGYVSTGIGAPWATNIGIPTGWTHSFATDAVLALPNVRVSGKRLAKQGPAFKVVIVGPDQFNGNETAMSIEGAKKLLSFAKAGLPIILLGDWTNAFSTGHVSAAADATVKATIVELLTQPSVSVAADEASIPAALAAAGITPAVTYDTSTLMNVHRVDGAVDFYYLANARHAENRKIVAIDQTAWLAPSKKGLVPYALDTWTGTVTRIAEYTTQGGRIGVRVALNPGESTVVALAAPGWAGEGGDIRDFVVSTTADSAEWKGRELLLVAASGGPVTAKLSSGRTLKGIIPAVPSAITLSQWTLTAEDWQPGAAPDKTVKRKVTVRLGALAPWTGIPQLADASGVGHYTASIDVPHSWGNRPRAVLDLGLVTDTFRVWVNGVRIASEGVITTKLDLGGHLKSGRNTVEVEVATTLINRLRTVTPAVYGIATPQAYGLMGPVTLTPYAEVVAR